MNKSAITKKYEKLSAFYFMLSIVVTFLPVLIYLILAFTRGTVTQKVTLGITFTVAVLLVIVNLIFKFHIRSILWIVVLGIYFCIKNIMPLLLLVAIGTILDEFILTPLHKMYKNKKNINLEIDKRMA